MIRRFMNIFESYKKVSGEDDVKKIILKIPLLKPVFIVLMVITFAKPYVDTMTPVVKSGTDYVKYKLLKSHPPGIVGHSYLSGEYMRGMQDSLSDSLKYRNGNGGVGDDWMDILFFNYRNSFLQSLGYLDYQSAILSEILSSQIDELSELAQGNTFKQINSLFVGFLDRKDKHLSDLYQAAYNIEGAANFLAAIEEEHKKDNYSYNRSVADQFIEDAYGFYSRAKKNLKYWLPPLHLTQCKERVTYSQLRDDQNRLKNFLKIDSGKPSFLSKENKSSKIEKTWLKPIDCREDKS